MSKVDSVKFRKWFASLPKDQQREVAAKISVTSGFQEAAAKISWDKKAVQAFNNNLEFLPDRPKKISRQSVNPGG